MLILGDMNDIQNNNIYFGLKLDFALSSCLCVSLVEGNVKIWVMEDCAGLSKEVYYTCLSLC